MCVRRGEVYVLVLVSYTLVGYSLNWRNDSGYVSRLFYNHGADNWVLMIRDVVEDYSPRSLRQPSCGFRSSAFPDGKR